MACWLQIKFRFLLKDAHWPRLIEPYEGIKQRLFLWLPEDFTRGLVL